LRSRLAASLKLYQEGKLPGVTSIPGASVRVRPTKSEEKSSKSFVGAADTPFLSKLMQRRGFSGNLGERVEDAKTKTDLGGFFLPGDDSDDGDALIGSGGTTPPKKSPVVARLPAPAVMRVPARTTSPPPTSSTTRPVSSKGLSSHM
jgi:ADA HAT complex component 1